MSPKVAIHRFSAANVGDFARVHCDQTGNGWCHCVAWWVPSWEGWGERTAAQNLALRQKLSGDGVHDGYFVHADDALAGWVQAWKRDDFAKLATQFGVTSDPDAWMIGCVLILPAFRGRGVVRAALQLIVSDLRLRGARSIDAFPKRGASDAGELWNGPESTYAHLGFVVVRDDAKRPLLRLTL